MKNSLIGLDFIDVMFLMSLTHFFFLFFSVCYFRHIGHVGWDPNTGFDVSYFQAINIITLNMWECHVLPLDSYSYTFLSVLGFG